MNVCVCVCVCVSVRAMCVSVYCARFTRVLPVCRCVDDSLSNGYGVVLESSANDV
jgi:hypothetical protein